MPKLMEVGGLVLMVYTSDIVFCTFCLFNELLGDVIAEECHRALAASTVRGVRKHTARQNWQNGKSILSTGGQRCRPS